MPHEIAGQLAYTAGEAISENIGDKLDKIPYWKKIRTYLVLVPVLVCTIYLLHFHLNGFETHRFVQRPNSSIISHGQDAKC